MLFRDRIPLLSFVGFFLLIIATCLASDELGQENAESKGKQACLCHKDVLKKLKLNG